MMRNRRRDLLRPQKRLRPIRPAKPLFVRLMQSCQFQQRYRRRNPKQKTNQALAGLTLVSRSSGLTAVAVSASVGIRSATLRTSFGCMPAHRQFSPVPLGYFAYANLLDRRSKAKVAHNAPMAYHGEVVSVLGLLWRLGQWYSPPPR